MNARQEVESRMIVDGQPVIIKLISHPLIDDVVITESRLQAYNIQNGISDTEHRVDRGMRDFLIRLGVER